MKGLKLNIKKEAMETAGNGVGLALAYQVNKIPFISSKSPLIRGLATLIAGRIGIPFIAGMAGLNGKKGGDVLEGVKQGMATHGLNIVLSSTPATQKFVPTISGYEDNIYGMGLVSEEGEEMAGYEDTIYGADDTTGDGVYD